MASDRADRRKGLSAREAEHFQFGMWGGSFVEFTLVYDVFGNAAFYQKDDAQTGKTKADWSKESNIRKKGHHGATGLTH